MNKLATIPLLFSIFNFYPVIADIKSGIGDQNYKEEINEVIEFTRTLNDYNETDLNLIWEDVLEPEKLPINKIKWDLYNEKDYRKDLLHHKTTEQKFNLLRKDLYKSQVRLNLGEYLPTANTLEMGDLVISFNQNAPFKSSYGSAGTGNQNYLFSSNYGIHQDITLGIFFTHSDDPLHKKINNHSSQTANRWISYGASFTWQGFKSQRRKISLAGSLENWNVKSGGCNLYNCNYSSKNIFNSSNSSVENNNLVGSISVPITWYLTEKLDVSLSPRLILLPKSQGNSAGSGNFYGNNFGIGTGFEYRPYNRLKAFSSIFFPIGPGYNSFDQDLLFSRKNIFTSGINYSLDSKISFEASLSNSFGKTPSTSILTIPSDNELIYNMKLIYRPNNYYWSKAKDKIPKEINSNGFNGLSVSTAEIVNEGKKNSSLSYDNQGTWLYKHIWGLSELFNLDISISKIGQNSHSSGALKDKYHSPQKVFIRGGGKAKIFSQSRGDFLTSSLRLSAGRLKGNGWVFGEILNTYKLNKRAKLHFNPKASFSGAGNPAGFGTSIELLLTPHISLIPETNIALKEGSTNWSLILRISPSENKYIDLFSTNSLSFIDTGQLMRAEEQSFGINIGTIF